MPALPFILGISAYYHDSAAALLRAGEIVAAAQEERFTRRKNDERFPLHAIRFCLEQAKLQLELTKQAVQLEVEQSYLIREEARLRIGATKAALARLHCRELVSTGRASSANGRSAKA